MTDTYTIFQFVAAGLLILAWSYVLGRPVLSKISYLIRRMRSDDGGIEYVRPTVGSLGLSVGGKFFRPFVSWRDQKVFARRRQIFLGLFVAAVASAVVAVFLRGPFVYMAATLTFLFGAYFVAAIRMGGRLVQWQRHLVDRDVRREERPRAKIRIPDASDIAIDAVRPASGSPATGVNRSLVEQDATDPTLKVKGSRQRARRVRDTSRRIMFRRPKTGNRQSGQVADVSSTEWEHLDKAANDG